MKYNFFLESDDEDDDKDKKEDDDKKEKEDDDDDTSTDNDYLGDSGDDDDSDFDDDDDTDSDTSTDNDYLGDSDDETSSEEDYGTGEEDSSGLFNKLAKCAYGCVVVANNMKHIHLHVSGKKFDRTHALSEEFYVGISNWTDDFCELALEDKATKIDNLSNSAQYVAEITLETEEDYDYSAAYTAMNANLRHILECIKCAREAADSRTDVQSKLDDYIGYLNKQINFLMERRQATNESFSFDVK